MNQKEIKIFSPADGTVIPIGQVQDEVFSQKILGDGIAVEPTGDFLVAPCAGVISNVDTNTPHACGLTLDCGAELLFHIGIDTVDMHGDGFACFVRNGQRVQEGQKLIAFDTAKIKKAGHPATVIMVVCDLGSAKKAEVFSNIEAKGGKTCVLCLYE